MELETIRTIVFTILLGVLPFLSVLILLINSYYTMYRNEESDITFVLFAFALMLPALIILASIASQLN
jgi:hypothetical protein